MAGAATECILSGRAYEAPRGMEGGRRLLSVARVRPGGDAWHACLAEADITSIIQVIGWLGEESAPRMGAYRDAARAVLEQRLTARMAVRLDALERASRRLGWIAIAALAIAFVELLALHGGA